MEGPSRFGIPQSACAVKNNCRRKAGWRESRENKALSEMTALFFWMCFSVTPIVRGITVTTTELQWWRRSKGVTHTVSVKFSIGLVIIDPPQRLSKFCAFRESNRFFTVGVNRFIGYKLQWTSSQSTSSVQHIKFNTSVKTCIVLGWFEVWLLNYLHVAVAISLQL